MEQCAPCQPRGKSRARPEDERSAQLSTRRLTFGSLFSGIGGFDLAFERAGMACRWQVEIDARCQDVLGRHWPEVERHSDIRECGRHNLEPVDVVCGGFPCQDLSVAGRRAGLAGERSGLWFEFHRVLTELEPRWVVIENVPGLLSSNRGRDFATVIRGLVELRYGVCWRVLDAQYFGVAQRRRRVFIVGHLGDGRAAEVLFEREGVPGDTPPSRETGQEVAYSLRANASHSGDKGDGGVNTTLVAMAVNAHQRYDAESETFIYQDSQYGCNAYETAGTLREGRLPHHQMIAAYNIQHNDGGEHKRKDRPNGGLYVNETDTALTVGTADTTAVCFEPRYVRNGD